MLENLPADVRAELEDEEYAGRKHHSRATYALGCHGPLCKRAERTRGRGRTERRASEAGREYQPNLDIRVDDAEIDLAAEQYLSWYDATRDAEEVAS